MLDGLRHQVYWVQSRAIAPLKRWVRAGLELVVHV